MNDLNLDLLPYLLYSSDLALSDYANPKNSLGGKREFKAKKILLFLRVFWGLDISVYKNYITTLDLKNILTFLVEK